MIRVCTESLSKNPLSSPSSSRIIITIISFIETSFIITIILIIEKRRAKDRHRCRLMVVRQMAFPTELSMSHQLIMIHQRRFNWWHMRRRIRWIGRRCLWRLLWRYSRGRDSWSFARWLRWLEGWCWCRSIRRYEWWLLARTITRGHCWHIRRFAWN